MPTVLRPMRETVRRTKIRKAQAAGEKIAAQKIAASLHRRYQVLKRELRRANLRKRLHKTLRLYSAQLALIKSTGNPVALGQVKLAIDQALFKANGRDDWSDWANNFTLDVKSSLNQIVFGVYDTEGVFWASRGQRLDPLDTNVLIASYEARTGRQISQLAEDTRNDVLNTIADWYSSDESLPELIDRLGQYFSPERAEMIARTESSFITSEIARQAMQQFGIKLWNFDLAEEDGEYPCQQCIDYADANPHSVDDDMPPVHPNCILPGNEIVIPDLVAATKSFYVGRCIEVSLANGCSITVTQNHPILTPSGWVKAQFLGKGDNVIVATDANGIAKSINPDYDYRPTAIEEIFNSCVESSEMLSTSMESSAEQFNGDGRFVNGNVDIVYMNSLLRDSHKSALNKVIGQIEFNLSGVSSEVVLNGNSFGYFGLQGNTPTPHGGAGISGSVNSLFGSHSSPFHRFGLGLSAPTNAVTKQNTGHDIPTNPPLTSEFIFRFASKITANQIVRIRKFDFSGHVYDLQASEYELYICNGIITHNCRCGVVYINANEESDQ